MSSMRLRATLHASALTDAIVIVRRDQSVIPVNYKRIADGKDASQNVVLAAGDTIVVP